MNNQKLIEIRKNIEKVIIGKSENIDLILTALLAGGHVLLDDCRKVLTHKSYRGKYNFRLSFLNLLQNRLMQNLTEFSLLQTCFHLM